MMDDYEEFPDYLFPRKIRKYKLVKKLRDFLDGIHAWWKYSVYSPKEWKYRLKMKFWTKPNKVHVKYFADHFWVDRCSLIRHACFQILVDFVEKERPFEWFDTEDSYHKAEWDELKSLYDWYKNFQEFDSIEYQTKLLGYNPYTKERCFQAVPLVEEYGLNDWGEPKMYEWVGDTNKQEVAALLESAKKEEEFDAEFTAKAVRVVQLWRMLWT